MRHIPQFHAYSIQLNSAARIEKEYIAEWLEKYIKGYILDNQMISVLFFSEADAFLFHLTFFNCMQSFYLRELSYKPQNEKILKVLVSHYQDSIIK